MDYSKYYLKNYKERKQGSENVKYDNAYYRFYRSEEQLKNQPEIIYEQPPARADEESVRADIEYDPSQYERAYAKPDAEIKRGGTLKRRIWLIALCLCIAALSGASVFLAADIISNGAVIAAIKSDARENSSVYVSYLQGCVDMESARLQGEEMRKAGLGGYIFSNGGELRVYADVAVERDELCLTLGESEFAYERMDIAALDLEKYPENMRAHIEKYQDHTQIFIGYTFDILQKIRSGEYDLALALSAAKSAFGEFYAYAGEAQSGIEGQTDVALIEFAANIRAEAAFLSALSEAEEINELLADLRYYSLLALFIRLGV